MTSPTFLHELSEEQLKNFLKTIFKRFTKQNNSIGIINRIPNIMRLLMVQKQKKVG